MHTKMLAFLGSFVVLTVKFMLYKKWQRKYGPPHHSALLSRLISSIGGDRSLPRRSFDFDRCSFDAACGYWPGRYWEPTLEGTPSSETSSTYLHAGLPTKDFLILTDYKARHITRPSAPLLWLWLWLWFWLWFWLWLHSKNLSSCSGFGFGPAPAPATLLSLPQPLCRRLHSPDPPACSQLLRGLVLWLAKGFAHADDPLRHAGLVIEASTPSAPEEPAQSPQRT